jgi:Family of unknown function (DUF5719)
VTEGKRRLAFVVLLVVVFVGVAVVDRAAPRPAPSVASATQETLEVAQVAATDVESAAWYCAGGPGTVGAGSSSALVLVNSTGRPVDGSVAWASPSTASGAGSASVTVPAWTTITVPGTAPDAAATVTLRGGGVGAWEQVTGPSGWSVVPCAAASAPQWYFAAGSTRNGDALTLSLYNPDATDAVVDIDLLTSTGGALAPAAYQGIDLPAGALVVENIGDHVQNDPSVAATVTALSGSLVAYERQSTGQPGTTGLSVVLGTPRPAQRCAFALSTDATGGSVTFDLLNPASHAATVTAAVGLAHGAAVPFRLTVPAGSTAALAMAKQTRVPPDTPYSLSLSSSVGIVAARTTVGPGGSPAPQAGTTPAAGYGARRLLLPPLDVPGTSVWYLAVTDLAGTPVTLAVRSLGRRGASPVHGIPPTVSPGAPVFVGPDPGALLGSSALEVVASGPVAAELVAHPSGAPGVVAVAALALG